MQGKLLSVVTLGTLVSWLRLRHTTALLNDIVKNTRTHQSVMKRMVTPKNSPSSVDVAPVTAFSRTKKGPLATFTVLCR